MTATKALVDRRVAAEQIEDIVGANFANHMVGNKDAMYTSER